MPNNAALTIAGSIIGIDCFHDFFNGKELLIPADLLDVGIIQDEVFAELHQPFRSKQRYNVSVLNGRLAPHNILINQFVLPIRILLMPNTPKVFTGSTGCIFDCVFIGCHDDLRKLKQLRNIVLALIADHLFNRLFFADCRRFALDNAKGNAVYKQHNVGASIFLLVPTVARIFFCYMKNIVFGVFPVNVFQIKAF